MSTMVLVVEVDDHSAKEKPFLGGWRNTITGLVYHNACTQTLETFSKEQDVCIAVTQTVDVADESTNVGCDRATQVYNLPDLQDRILKATPCKIGPSNKDDHAPGKDIENCVRKIQRYYRAYRAKVLIDKFFDLGTDAHEEKQGEIPTLPSGQVDFTVLNSIRAETKRDFDLFRDMLDRWRTLEYERANRFLFGPSKIATCGVILSKEVEILRAIDSMKTTMKFRRRERERRRFLDDSARAVNWKNHSGDWITVYTPRAEKARDCRKKYELLCDEGLAVSDRTKLLLALKEEALLHCCARSAELSYLIDQELCLLSRDVEPRHLGQLRSRLKLSFLRLARNVLGAESGDGDSTALPDPTATKLCETCGRLLPLPKFSRDKRFRLSTCRYCASLQTAAGQQRFLYEPYERMLAELRCSETKMGCRDGLAFAIGPTEIRQLVNSVWLGKSPLSECDDIEFLRLVRFQRDVQWSPWNCILLAKPEAAVHRLIENVQDFYGSQLLQLFKSKNLQAKLYFSNLANAQGNE